MNSSTIASHAQERYPESVTHRKIGLEYEYPLVFADGRPVGFDVVRGVFEALEQLGWSLTMDETTGQPAAAARRTPTAGEDVVTLEFGVHTIEVNVAPADNLFQGAQRLQSIVDIVVEALRRHDAFMIGYGIQPLAEPGPANVAPRGRYRVLERSWIGPADGRADIHLLGLSAACQTHVDVTEAEAIPAVNALNATSGLRVALLANSPVWRGRPDEYAATRELFWDWAYPARKAQIGIPRRFESMAHYVRCLLDFRGLMTRRGGEFFLVDNTQPYRAYFHNAVNPVESVEGETVELELADDDLSVLWGLAWYDARLQPAYGTVEDRCACQQPPGSHLAASALTLGLVENLAEFTSLADRLSIDQWRDLRLRACHDGITLDRGGLGENDLVECLLEIAANGLASRGCGEEVLLAPLRERLSDRAEPATEARTWFSTNGASGIVSQADMARFLEEGFDGIHG